MRRIIAGISVVLLSVGCDGDVRRTMSLHPALSPLPHVETSLTGDELDVTGKQLEPLEDDFQYVAWAQDASGTTALGTVAATAETLTVQLSQAGVDAGTFSEIFVTEEAAGPPPASPSMKVRFRGSPGGELPYLPLAGVDLQALSASVTLHDYQMTAELHGLPALAEGLHYALWLGFKYDLHNEGGHNNAETAHAELSLGSHDGEPEPATAGHDEDEECAGPLPSAACMPSRLLGSKLDGGDLNAFHTEMVGGAWWAFVTIESDAGHGDDMSPTLILWGEVEAEVADPGEGAGGGHVH